MKSRAAAKGRRLLFLAAVCLLSTVLAASQAEGSRTLPRALTPPSTPPAPSLDALVDAGDAGHQLDLLTAEDRLLFEVLAGLEPSEVDRVISSRRLGLYHRFAALPHPLGEAAIFKLASGVETWGTQPNIWQKSDLTKESRWTLDLYAFVAWGPHVGVDPMGENNARYRGAYARGGIEAVNELPEVQTAREYADWCLSNPEICSAQANQRFLAIGDAVVGHANQSTELIDIFSNEPTTQEKVLGGIAVTLIAVDVGANVASGGLARRAKTGIGVLGKAARSAPGKIRGWWRALRGRGDDVADVADELLNVVDDAPGRGPGSFVAKNESMSTQARAYEDAVAGGQPGQVYRVPYDNPNPRGRPQVDFDGLQGNLPVDAKLSVVTRPKSVNQAIRQAEALAQNDAYGVWKVTSLKEARRARAVLRQAEAEQRIFIVVENP